VLERPCPLDEEDDVVRVAKPPVLARFVGLDDRVVTVGRAITATDVATGHAHPQMDPPAADAQTVRAPVAARLDIGDLVEMTAGIDHVVPFDARCRSEEPSQAQDP
jgi:hypothetical protein